MFDIKLKVCGKLTVRKKVIQVSKEMYLNMQLAGFFDADCWETNEVESWNINEQICINALFMNEVGTME